MACFSSHGSHSPGPLSVAEQPNFITQRLEPASVKVEAARPLQAQKVTSTTFYLSVKTNQMASPDWGKGDITHLSTGDCRDYLWK